MLKKNMLLLLLFCISILINCSKQNTNDVIAIRQASLDYIEGWYNGDAERMEKALHPSLVKRIITNPVTNSKLGELNKETMVNNTKYGGGKHVPKNNYKIEVKIFDIQKNIASVMTKSEYTDYLHLGKFNNKWVIINVLWDFNR